MQCTAVFQTTSGEDVRDFTKLLRNKLMSRKKKNSRLGYLPVTSLEAETPDSPSLSPGRSVSRQEMAERLEVLQSRLQEVDTRYKQTHSLGWWKSSIQSKCKLEPIFGRKPCSSEYMLTVSGQQRQ